MPCGPPLTTSVGAVQCVGLDRRVVHRVGYRPRPWDWTPWEYAAAGRFDGRWDDPDGIWRMLYTGSTELSCYLEVLAPFRPDPVLVSELAEVVDDDERFPTGLPGLLARDWCGPRLMCSGTLSGLFALPGHHESLPTLRKRFLASARRYGYEDVDAGLIRDGNRTLTQQISSWLRAQSAAEGRHADGIEYQSRHGDFLTLWAIYERDVGSPNAPAVTGGPSREIGPSDTALVEALRIHEIRWKD